MNRRLRSERSHSGSRRASRYITDLELSEFSVFEDGVKQDVTYFSRRQEPLALSLVLDSSASMEQLLSTLQTAATSFVRRLRPNDLAQVIDFDSRVVVRQPFTVSQGDLEAAIRQLVVGGSTSLYNAIFTAVKELGKRRVSADADVRRQGVIVFSDGEDTSSPGGRAFFPVKVEDLTGVYAQIADELASQYTLGYTAKNPKRDGAWRRATVSVSPFEAHLVVHRVGAFCTAGQTPLRCLAGTRRWPCPTLQAHVILVRCMGFTA